ncbi:MAG: MBL fold metallo-hydrolase [Promethearchaeota archaeon]
MTRIKRDIFYFRHPLDANCVVFAFLVENNKSDRLRPLKEKEFDLIDTGIRKLGIYRNLLYQMRRDGLNPKNVRNIFHTHVHFDHVQMDTWFQEKAVKNKGNVNIYIPKPDLYRFNPKYRVIRTNIRYINEFFGNLPTKEFRSFLVEAKYILDPLMKYKTPKNIATFNDSEILHIGNYQAKAFTTGGHTEGHSLIYFPKPEILHTGDNDAVNELLVDFKGVMESMKIARKLNPKMIFIGHNGPKLNQKDAFNWIDRWFREYKKIAALFKKLMQNGREIDVTSIMKKMLGWSYSLGFIRFFGFMRIFVILKFLQDNGLGKMEVKFHQLSENGGKNIDKKVKDKFPHLYFRCAQDIEDMKSELFDL